MPSPPDFLWNIVIYKRWFLVLFVYFLLLNICIMLCILYNICYDILFIVRLIKDFGVVFSLVP